MSAIIEHDEIHFYCLVATVLNCNNILHCFRNCCYFCCCWLLFISGTFKL